LLAAVITISGPSWFSALLLVSFIVNIFMLVVSAVSIWANLRFWRVPSLTPRRQGRWVNRTVFLDLQEDILILIVEDNRVNAMVIQEILSRLGYITDIAEDGQEALSKVRGVNYAVILMDIQMPVMDGLEATREIRRLEREGILTRHIPIIAVTAHALKEDRELCLVVGMDDYLSKPVRREDLRAILEKFTLSA
jgi:CheY-like chemotaxis protein